MAFTPFNFTKSWRNAGDFPTFEPDEAKVRDDMQSLFDELKVGLNRLIGELKASNMPFTPTAEVDSSDVQNAIENVQSQIAQAILGELPDGSVTTVKLADEAIETGKIADGAVTSDKLDDEAVTAAKLADDAVSTGSIADGAVTGDKIADGTIPLAKLSTEALNAKADLVSGKVKPEQISKARVNVTASRALELTDEGKALYISSGSAVTVTIPANSTVQLPIGSEIILYRAGTGTVIVDAASGVTLHCSGDLNGLGQYDTAKLKKWEANVWTYELAHNGVSDGEITAAKLADGAVGTSKLSDGAVTEGKIGANAVSTVYTATLNTTWSGSAAPYSKAQTINGILASDYPIVDLVPSGTFATAEQQEEAWANVYRVVASANTLTFYAKEKPTVSLPIKVQCVRK